MNRSDWGWVALLASFAAFIWMRDTAWEASADDTLPILGAIPLFIWLGMPWNFQSATRSCKPFCIGCSDPSVFGGDYFKFDLSFSYCLDDSTMELAFKTHFYR